mgnify:CR=1 FL=1
MKKWIALLLCLLMTASFLPAALAEETGDQPVELPEISDEPLEEPEQADPVEETTDAAEPVELTPEGNLNINVGVFPDKNFREWVKANLAGGKDYLTSAEVTAVTVIDCSHESIESLKGISHFTNLQYLYCSGNKLTTLELNGNKKLLGIECDDNDLTNISISACTKLKSLICPDNKLKSLNLSYNKELQSLICNNNELAKVNIENVTTLVNVDAHSNKLPSINNLAKNKKLAFLDLSDNPVASITLTANTELESLYLSKTKISKLDVTKNTKLVDLEVNKAALKAIDVTKCPKLKRLDLGWNAITAIDVTKNPELTVLDVSHNQLKTLDVTKNTKLVTLNVESNTLSALDVSACTDLTGLNVNSNSLKALDVSANTNLLRLYAYSNLLTELDVSALTKLIELDCDSNEIAALDVSACTELTALDCGNNSIEALDLAGLSKLKTLYCQANRISALNVAACPELETLSCGGNRIPALHLEGNTKLKDPTFSTQETAAVLNLVQVGNKYTFDMTPLFASVSDLSYVKPYDSSYSYDALSGVMMLPGNVKSFKYKFETGYGDMTVVVTALYNGYYTLEFDSGAVQYKGTTPYVIYHGAEQRPAFVGKDSSGKTLDLNQFEVWYTDNVLPGTGTLHVRLIGSGVEKTLWFKIYMPPTTETSVANVKDGIEVKWAPVKDAKGYVIYRRAWNLTSSGWTPFERWNNTTATTWMDTKVYAGTRYQYGVKAYFSDPMDNYNLGEVGPLKTTVRITTRTLNSVTPGAKLLTAKWSPSSVFTGYEVQIATNSAFTQDVKTVKITKATTAQTTVKSLKAATTYYVRVRSYHVFEGMTYYGQWSNVMNCKTN